jgi:hypothetical protein
VMLMEDFKMSNQLFEEGKVHAGNFYQK